MARVLVVDDEVEVAKAIARALARSGHVPKISTSPVDALVQLQGFAPDLVISDFKMPEMSGLELHAEVQRRRPGTPFLLVSGYAGTEGAGDGVGRGSRVPFLSKPWDTRVLLARVDEALGKGDRGAA